MSNDFSAATGLTAEQKLHEAVARAFCAADGIDPDGSVGRASEWQGRLGEARKTIKALRDAELTIGYEMQDAVYTEGVCADGAAILRDGEMMTVSDILATLNAYGGTAAAEPREGEALAESVWSAALQVPIESFEPATMLLTRCRLAAIIRTIQSAHPPAASSAARVAELEAGIREYFAARGAVAYAQRYGRDLGAAAVITALRQAAQPSDGLLPSDTDVVLRDLIRAGCKVCCGRTGGDWDVLMEAIGRGKVVLAALCATRADLAQVGAQPAPDFECENCISMPEHGCYCKAHGASAPGGPASQPATRATPVQVDAQPAGRIESHIMVYIMNANTLAQAARLVVQQHEAHCDNIGEHLEGDDAVLFAEAKEIILTFDRAAPPTSGAGDEGEGR